MSFLFKGYPAQPALRRAQCAQRPDAGLHEGYPKAGLCIM